MSKTGSSTNMRWADYDIRDLTIGHVLRKQAERVPNKVYLTDLSFNTTYTFQEAHALTNRLANGLLSLGVVRGDHVALMMDNRAEQILLHFAIGKIGAVAVPVNTGAKGKLLSYFLNQSDAKVFAAEPEYLARYRDVAADVPNIKHLISIEDESGADITTFAKLAQAPDNEPDATAKFTDLAMIMYTSGTTGPSKGVMFAHARTFLWERIGQEHHKVSGDDCVYVSLPLFHAAALLGSAYTMAALGGSVALTRRFSASNYWNEIRETKATITTLMGSMVNILCTQPVTPNDGSHSLRLVKTAPFPKIAEEFESRFHLKCVSGYGLTDYGVPTLLTSEDPVSKQGSLGKADGGWEVRILDEDDIPLPAGQVGEICLWTPYPWHSSTGYYKMPEATLESRRNDWFHSGDRGYIDEDGYVWFVDRKKDAIRRRGENISAYEVEQVIYTHPAVADVAVYPLQSEMSEDEVAATIVLRPDAKLTAEELVQYCAKNMSYFMVPRFVEFADDLPRNFSQKIEKYKIKAAAEADRSKLWDREKAGIRITR